MPNESNSPSGVLSDIVRHLDAIIRHMLPGVVVVGGARLACPGAFSGVDLKSWQHLLLLAAITVTVGNALFALNRCGVHQILEYILYRRNIKGPIPKSGSLDYVNDLADYVVNSFRKADTRKGIRQHIQFRVSTGFLLLTISETALVFGFHHNTPSKVSKHLYCIAIIGVASFGAYIWQSIITRRIDYLVVTGETKDHPTN